MADDAMMSDVRRMLGDTDGVVITSEALDQFVAQAVGTPFRDERSGKNGVKGRVTRAWREGDRAMICVKLNDGGELTACALRVNV